MGRYDIGRLVDIFFRKSLSMNVKTLVFFIPVLFFICSTALKPQSAKDADTEKDDTEPITYKLFVKYPTKVYNVYKINEHTDSWRQYSDSSVKEYERDVTYFITQVAPSLPEDGFQTVRVVFDSLRYRFKEGEAEFTFNSQDEELPSVNFMDLTVSSVPQGREFNMTYSPYGEVADIGGESIEWLENYINEQAVGSTDTLTIYVWLNGISDLHLKYLGDLQKRLIPNGRVTLDSTWKTFFEFELDGVSFYDSVRVSIDDYANGIFNIKAEADSLKAYSGKYRLYGIKNHLVDIDASRGKGTYRIKLTPRGAISYAEADFYAEMVPRVSRERFKQKVKTKVTWELLGQFTWK